MARDNDNNSRNKASSRLPVDRGWAWVILSASIINEILIIGIWRSFGILIAEFLELYQQNVAITSSLMGLSYGIYSLTTLVILTGGQFLSSRQAVITGGVLSTISFVLSCFAKDIYFMMFSLSIVFGIGAGFVTGPSLVLLGKYFKKKRCTVNIIVITSGSFGGVLFAPLCQSLIEFYGGKGALIVIGGLLMNLIVTGSLMRPVNFYKPKKKERKQDPVLKPLINENMDGLAPRSFSLSESTYSPLARKAMLFRMRSRTETESSDTVPYSVDDTILTSISRQSQVDTRATPNKLLETLDEIHQTKTLKTSMYSCQGDMLNIVLSDFKFAKKKSSPKDNKKLNEIHENGYSREDINKKKKKDDEEESCCKKLFNAGVMKNRTFKICLSILLLNSIGITYPVVFIPVFAREQGYDEQMMTLLVSLACITDIIIRLVIGFLADKNMFKARILVIISLIVAGIMSSLTVFYTEYWCLALFSIIHGVCGATVFSLYLGEFCKLVGNKTYQHGFAIIMCGQGVLQIITVPILGALRDITGTYTASFHMMGVASFLAAVLLVIETLLSISKERKGLSINLDTEHEKAVYHSRRRRSSI